uniref:Uncharacterized protein n=1 Tax=Amphora coffeiformis TaxID=265554 RepID=A0A7S3L0K3_9STRA
MTTMARTSRIFFAIHQQPHCHYVLLAFMTVLNLPGGEAHFADNENDPNCLPMDNFTITNEHTQSPCLQLELEPLDTGAAIAVGAIGILWILGGIYLAMYHSMHGPHHHRGRRQQQPRRGECSESGDTEADSTWDVESVLAQPNDAEVPTNTTNENMPYLYVP